MSRTRGRDRDPRLTAVWRTAFVCCLLAFPAPAKADYAAGAAAYQKGDYAAAFREWSADAAAGDAHAQQGLGVLYENGEGVPARDFPRAVEWYRAAAAQGLPAGPNNLALLYADGRGVPRNPVMAAELWHAAAAAGYPIAQFNLALAYEQGFGVARDEEAAARWYAEAGNRGVADAAFALSELYRTGRGVPQHDQLAKLWHDVAVKFGSKLAAHDNFATALPTVPPPGPVVVAPPKPKPRQASTVDKPAAKPPPPAAATASASPPAASPPPSSPSAQPTAQAGPAGAGFSVQVASSQSEADAAALRDTLATRYRGQLDGVEFYVQRTDLGAGKGVWYRVYAGRFQHRDAAAGLCARLKSTGCLIAAVK